MRRARPYSDAARRSSARRFERRGISSSALVLIAIVLSSAGGAAAQPADAGSGGPPGDETTIRALRDEQRTERRTFGLWRARVSHPLRISAGLGLLSARVPVAYDCRTVCRMTGWLAELEPGVAGVQLAAGYGTVLGEHAARRRLVERAYLGYGVRAALLRTFGDSSLRPSGQTLAGVEGQFTVINVSVSLGLFRHISGGDPADRWLVTGGLGLGF